MKTFSENDNENMITEAYISELNENISIYGLIVFFFFFYNKDNKLHLITSEHKFNLKKNTYKNKIEFKLGKVHTKTLFNTPRHNVLHFGILCRNRNKQ